MLLVVWALLAVVLGAIAPRVDTALAGAGWEASGSESVQARTIAQRDLSDLSSAALQVVVHCDSGSVASGPGAAAIGRAMSLLRADPRISRVIAPSPGVLISRDGRTAVVQAGARTANANEMLPAADSLKTPLRKSQRPWRDGGADGRRACGVTSTQPTATP